MAFKHNKTGRSLGERFVKLTWFMLESAAWRSLTPSARAVYIELVRVYNGRNNGFIGLSVRCAAERCRINKDTAAKAFKQLQETGFIECVTPGGFSRKVPHATEWRLTAELCNKTGAVGTKDFMRWQQASGRETNQRSQLSSGTVP